MAHAEGYALAWMAAPGGVWKPLPEFTQACSEDHTILAKMIGATHIDSVLCDGAVGVAYDEGVDAQFVLFCDEEGILARKVCNDCASAAASYRIFGDVILVLIDPKEKCYAFKPHV